MLAGLLHLTAGQIRVGGYVPFEQKAEFKKMMSLVMGQKSQLIWDIPLMETFKEATGGSCGQDNGESINVDLVASE